MKHQSKKVLSATVAVALSVGLTFPAYATPSALAVANAQVVSDVQGETSDSAPKEQLDVPTALDSCTSIAPTASSAFDDASASSLPFVVAQGNDPAAPDKQASLESNDQAETVEPASVDSEASIKLRPSSGEEQVFSTLQAAFDAAGDGDAVVVSGSIATDMVVLENKGTVTLQTDPGAPAAIVRSEGQGVLGFGIFETKGNTVLKVQGAEDATLTLDGENRNASHPLLVARVNSELHLLSNVEVVNNKESGHEWGMLENEGLLVIDGATISGSYASRNAIFSNKATGTIEFKSGVMTGGSVSYSQAVGTNRGTFVMTGGEIRGNSTKYSDGVLNVSGSTFTMTGGVIKNNSSGNAAGLHINGGATLNIGGTARVEGGDRIVIDKNAIVNFTQNIGEGGATKDSPLIFVAGGSAAYPKGAKVISFIDGATVEPNRSAIKFLCDGLVVPLESRDNALYVASEDMQACFDLLDNPFADNLGFTFKDEIADDGRFAEIERKVTEFYEGVDSQESEDRLARLEWVKRQKAHLAEHYDEMAASVMDVSALGDPVADIGRTGQSFQFDNLDITGYYIKPEGGTFTLYVDGAKTPDKLKLVWRQVGETSSNKSEFLSRRVKSGLRNGPNQITINPGQNKGWMLFVANDSAEDTGVRVRFEGSDANVEGNDPIAGTVLHRHPYYIHDTEHPEKFWDYVQEIREYESTRVSEGASNMTAIQMGDNGNAQFSLRSQAAKDMYSSINSVDDAIAYIEKSNDAIQERLEMLWRFDGFDENDPNPVHRPSAMRVHTCFTSTVTKPSTMFASGWYFHMPESSAAQFLSGQIMYAWGMSHEYGHMLDNRNTVITEQTNNVYSVQCVFYGILGKYRQDGQIHWEDYHPQIKNTCLTKHYALNKENARNPQGKAVVSGVSDSFYNPMMWWLGTHFFDEWDYSDYDFDSSPYTPELAEQVGRYGAFGTSMRILRENASAVTNVTADKAMRIIVAHTMSTGYNFAEYVESMGKTNVSQEVKDFCSQYPSLPRKVQYFTIDSANNDGVGRKTYDEYGMEVAPIVFVGEKNADGQIPVTATMPAVDGLSASTNGYELYRDGQLIDYDRYGDKLLDVNPPNDGADHVYSVVAYDNRCNSSSVGFASDDIPSDAFDIDPIEFAYGEGQTFELPASDSAGIYRYTYEIADEGVARIENGSIVPVSAGSTELIVRLYAVESRPGPLSSAAETSVSEKRVPITVGKRSLSYEVPSAEIYAGETYDPASVFVPSLSGGSVVGNDVAVGNWTLSFADVATGVEVEQPMEPGEYTVTAIPENVHACYDVSVQTGTLTVKQDVPQGDWLEAFDADGNPVAQGAWTNSGMVKLSPSAKLSDGEVPYTLVAEEGGEFAASVVVDAEGVTEASLTFAAAADALRHAGARSAALATEVRIDRTAPEVALVLSEVGSSVLFEASDPAAANVRQSSGVSSVSWTVRAADGTLLAEQVVGAADAAGAAEGVFEGAIDLSGLDVAFGGSVSATAQDAAGNVSAETTVLLDAAVVTATFEFAAEDGQELPQEVLDVLPTAQSFTAGAALSAPQPVRTEVVVKGSGTWTFVGWSEPPSTVPGSDFVLRGVWSFAPEQEVGPVPEPDPQPGPGDGSAPGSGSEADGGDGVEVDTGVEGGAVEDGVVEDDAKKDEGGSSVEGGLSKTGDAGIHLVLLVAAAVAAVVAAAMIARCRMRR